MKSRRHTGALALLCLLGILILAVVGFSLVERLLGGTEAPAGGVTGGENASGVYFNGDMYYPRADLETILVIGVDQTTAEGSSRETSHQADFLALLIVDRTAESFRILHLNRDTMTAIPMTDIADREYATTTAQLALAHTYGTNDGARCRNTVKAVENLLYNLEIDHYISLTMDAVAVLNDSVGGVTVVIEEDMTSVDPAFTAGATLTLAGSQALSYVRARGGLEDSSNLSRMERQRQYIGALFEAFSAQSENEDTSLRTLLAVNDHMVSDCTADQLTNLTKTLKSYSYEGILTLPGMAVRGEEFMEYHVEETAVQKLVIELFYEVGVQ